jgi:hypothetical protein
MSVYDYGAGISPNGDLRELYFVQKQVADLIHAHPWLSAARRVSDCLLGLPREYARAVHYGMGGAEIGVSNNAAWTLMRKGLMMTAFCASLSPEMADMDADDWLAAGKPLMLACADSLSRSVQQRLVTFLEGGGKLLLTPTLPVLDENFQPCGVLAEYLGAAVQAGLPGKPAAASRPTAMQPVVFDACTRLPIGYELRLASGGVVILLERSWVIGRRWDEDMLRTALTRLGCEPIVRCDNPNVWTSLLSDGEHSLLFLMNFFTGPLTAGVAYCDPRTGAWVDTGRHTLNGVSVKVIEG